MTKLTIILGKRIGQLKNFEIDQMGLMLPMDGLHARINFPEQHSPFTGWTCPRHPDDYIPETMDDILWRLYHNANVQLWTYSEYMVSAIAQAVGDGKIVPSVVEVRLYADDNGSYRDFVISHEGVLGEGWPFGWFMPSN